MKYYLPFFLSFLLISCNKLSKDTFIDDVVLFKKIDSKKTNIKFSNILVESDSLNYFTYPYIYMGGGVSVGDINNDGFDDLFFTGNMVDNKLYLNNGDFTFQDITVKANISGDLRWYTGSTMADVNNDGFLDIYVSVSGKTKNSKLKENQLYINNGDLTFSEKSIEYKLNDSGQSVNSTFFDFDNDGDLDVYVANYPITPFNTSVDHYKSLMNNVNENNTDNLYRNDNGFFTKVTSESGIKQFNLSLSVTASDLNNDGWQDLYISSDFASPDFIYMNNKNGTFTNIVNSSLSHSSFYGMGVDIADFNNDFKLDILQMDMDAASNRRSKSNMASMNPRLFQDIEDVNFKTQYMQNSLQLQTSLSKEGLPIFSEISRLAGISSTDWSWGPLFADFDNDGFKDIFISNGTRREINNKDYFKSLNLSSKSNLQKAMDIPSEPIQNFIFKNNGDLTFTRFNSSWGLGDKTFSTGCAYSDLDNDGDLDLIVNNIDSEASIYKNTLSNSKYIQVELKGVNSNNFGLGAKVYVFTSYQNQLQELTLTRGFQSSISPKLHFGLNRDTELIDSIKVVWPNKKSSIIKQVLPNQILEINENSNGLKLEDTISDDKIFVSFCDSILKHKHLENLYNDFENEILLPHKTSNFGPGLSVGDFNGDGLDDFYIGGASKSPGKMFLQNKDGSFLDNKIKDLIEDSFYEDLGSLIFDADGDGDNDLYVVSGGNEFSYQSKFLQDRLYVNEGNGVFVKSINGLPKMLTSGNRVYKDDFDKDGDLDLFVGGRLVPGNYPYPAASYLLENISKGGIPMFKDVTQDLAPYLKKFGLVTSASFTDVNNDGWKDLVVVGEWMPIKILINDKGKKFIDSTFDYGLQDSNGWWFSIKSSDFDNDGDQDFIVGNLGLNYKYQANENETFDIFFNDFDGNKKNDIVLGYYNDGIQYPVRGRECSSQQIPTIKKKFKNYEDYSNATLDDVYGSKLKKSLHYKVKSFKSIYLENSDTGFIQHPLPNLTQMAPVNQILIDDYNNDNHLDVILAGNLFSSEVETPRADAGIGSLLLGNSKGYFEQQDSFSSGLYMYGDVKDFDHINILNKKYVLVVKNNDYIQFVKIKAK